MHISHKFILVTILTLVGFATATSAFADSIRFGDGIQGRIPVVGIIGCDVHNPTQPIVAIFQVPQFEFETTATAVSDPPWPINEPCAEVLIKLQRHGLQLGQLVVSGAYTTDSRECLIWELKRKFKFDD